MSEWISVKDRLPEPGRLVVVYEPPHRDDDPRELRVGFDFIDPDSDGDYWFEHGERYEHYCCIAKGGSDVEWVGPSQKAPYTHWMPLEAPK